MDSQKQQAAERIKQANNILVTVSSNPSVDQLAACIGVTLGLNKMGKHATAVFSGEVPSTIEFLQPEKTLEKNTDSLRDFIIALDKSKADKLRYKVEDRVVKIFITPYRTSISEKDLEFSQGDFNVDVVLALGVHNQSELDQAITSHGRILHDATVITLNTRPGGELGSINWLDPNASSLSEMSVQLIDVLDKKLVDGQIATSFLTGIVAETERFSNTKTAPQTMSVAAELMAEGANQQLVATKLEAPAPPPPTPVTPIAQSTDGEHKDVPPVEEPPKPDDGTLEIAHDETKSAEEEKKEEDSEGAKEKSEDHHDEEPKEEPKAESPAEGEHKEEEKPQGPAVEQPKPEEERQPEPPILPAPEEKPEVVPPQIHIDEHGSMSPLEDLLPPKEPSEPPIISHHNQAPRMVLQPPTLGGQLTAAATPGLGEPEGSTGLPQVEPPAPVIGPVTSSVVGPTIMPPTNNSEEDEAPSGGSAPADSFLVGSGSMPVVPPSAPFASAPSDQPAGAQLPSDDNARTLSDIEKDVASPHLKVITPTEGPAANSAAPASDGMLPPLDPVADASGPAPLTLPTDGLPPASTAAAPSATLTSPVNDLSDQPPADAPAVNDASSTSDNVSSARDAVAQAINSSAAPPLDPIASLNAQPVNLPMGGADAQPAAANAPASPAVPVQPWTPPEETAQPASTQFDPQALNIEADNDPDAPPPVPPPMMPPTNPL